jgi:hypothetical protein
MLEAILNHNSHVTTTISNNDNNNVSASLDPDTTSLNDRKEIRYASNIDFQPLTLKACHMNVYNKAIKQQQQQPNYNEHQHPNNVNMDG